MAYTTIDDPSAYFQTALYNGNAGTQSITLDGSEDMQPDMVWIKCRSGTHATENHNLFDSVRGANKFMIPNGTTASTTDTNSLTAFNSDGFSLGTRTDVNGSGAYVGWNWKASGSTASNSNGSVTSTVSANTTAGFSICTFTNPSSAANFTFGHGLGVSARMFIMKGLNTSNWQVYHESMGNTNMLQLNYTNAKSSAANWWGSTSPTSSVCTVGADFVETNQTSVAYVFAEKKGYSKFGSYTGNGNADGTFVYTGFRPAWGMFKRTDNTADWYIYDNKRNTFNVLDDRLEANNSDAEAADGGDGNTVDYVSNGFKLRGSGGSMNDGTFVYMIFAEAPFVNSSGVPNNAR